MYSNLELYIKMTLSLVCGVFKVDLNGQIMKVYAPQHTKYFIRMKLGMTTI